MKYTNEFLARVYGAYYGAPVYDTHKKEYARKVTAGTISYAEDGNLSPFILAIVPISEITDEHAIHIASRGYNARVGKCDIKSTRVYRTSGGVEVELYAGENQTRYIQRWGIGYKTYEHDLADIDKLREWGYDCGYGDIPSLIEAGIAINCNTLNK